MSIHFPSWIEKYLSSHSSPYNTVYIQEYSALLSLTWTRTPFQAVPPGIVHHIPLIINLSSTPGLTIVRVSASALVIGDIPVLERKDTGSTSISYCLAWHWQYQDRALSLLEDTYSKSSGTVSHQHTSQRYLRPHHTSAALPLHTSDSSHTRPGCTDHSHNTREGRDTENSNCLYNTKIRYQIGKTIPIM